MKTVITVLVAILTEILLTVTADLLFGPYAGVAVCVVGALALSVTAGSVLES